MTVIKLCLFRLLMIQLKHLLVINKMTLKLIQLIRTLQLQLCTLMLSNRQVEQEMETVVGVLQPGPLGIIEHKFSAEEVRQAKSAVEKAVENWKRNAYLEKSNPIMKDYIDI
ncbi:hypothetical protein C5167_020357 [Papaver somniferum]|uniref:Uncharacterized protein n=1 Tax=Papaver somniferum TaxID=3469 RepID=A0A4Y7IWR9_PAPSO|nr:hypothetical protein C5167_020357 [Papaver somniferum]